MGGHWGGCWRLREDEEAGGTARGRLRLWCRTVWMVACWHARLISDALRRDRRLLLGTPGGTTPRCLLPSH
eukprot:1144017-Rhodomonas_salina.2